MRKIMLGIGLLFSALSPAQRVTAIDVRSGNSEQQKAVLRCFSDGPSQVGAGA